MGFRAGGPRRAIDGRDYEGANVYDFDVDRLEADPASHAGEPGERCPADIQGGDHSIPVGVGLAAVSDASALGATARNLAGASHA